MNSDYGSSHLPGGWDWPSDLPRQRRQPTPPPEPTPTQNSYTAPPPPTNDRPTSGTSGSQPKRKTWKPRQCRICLDTVLPTYRPPSENLPNFLQGTPNVVYEDENGRLLRPCKCKGSSQYVHEACLSAWRHSDPAYGSRHFYNCPTCGFQYRLSRLGWGKYISSSATQIALTLLIFTTVVFVLGFVSDTIIDLVLDPWGWAWRGFTWSRDDYYYDDDPATWYEHFAKGFASLGLLSFFKTILAFPIRYWSPARGRNTGRDRLQGITWVVVVIGALTFMFTVWKGVRHWSKRTLEKAGERVVDVQGDDDGDDEDDSL